MPYINYHIINEMQKRHYLSVLYVKKILIRLGHAILRRARKYGADGSRGTSMAAGKMRSQLHAKDHKHHDVCRRLRGRS